MLLVWTRRLGGDDESTAVEEALGPDRIERVRVGPLSVGAIHRVLRDQLARPVPRPTLLRLHEASGGNPMYALELARALGDEDAMHDPTQPLPVPERLEELVSARLDGFPAATHEALVLVSADSRLTPAQLGEAGIDEEALAPALDERVLELAGGDGPLHAPAARLRALPGSARGERRDAHRRLAGLVDDPLARARHLALSADLPDAELAATLEDAAGRPPPRARRSSPPSSASTRSG